MFKYMTITWAWWNFAGNDGLAPNTRSSGRKLGKLK